LAAIFFAIASEETLLRFVIREFPHRLFCNLTLRTNQLAMGDGFMKKLLFAVTALTVLACVSGFAQNNSSDEGGRVLGLETAWNHAIESKDTKALDMLLGNTFVAVENDGSVSSKSEFLASIKDPSYQPSQAVNEQMNVQVYGNARWSSEFSYQGHGKRQPYVHRETLPLTPGSSKAKAGMRRQPSHADHREVASCAS